MGRKVSLQTIKLMSINCGEQKTGPNFCEYFRKEKPHLDAEVQKMSIWISVRY